MSSFIYFSPRHPPRKKTSTDRKTKWTREDRNAPVESEISHLASVLCSARAKELAHYLGALRFYHAGHYLESMVQAAVAADIVY